MTALLPLVLSACSGGTSDATHLAAAASPLTTAEPAPGASPTSASDAVAAETAAPVQGMWKSTSVCVENLTSHAFNVKWTKYDTKQQQGEEVTPGDSSCAEGTFMGGADVNAKITFPNFESSYVQLGAGNPAVGPPWFTITSHEKPSMTLIAGICAKDFDQDDSRNFVRIDDRMHAFEVRRERDTNWKKFRVQVLPSWGRTQSDISCT